MFSEKISDVKNPIVYVFICMIISSICYGINKDFKELVIIIAGFFFISILYYCGRGFLLLIIIFFATGIIFNKLYYKMPDEISGIINISKVNAYGVTAEYEGKNIILDWKNTNLQSGERYYIYGKVTKDIDKEKGITGTVKIVKGRRLEDNFITKLQNMKKKIYDLLEDNIGSRKAGFITSIAFGYSDYLDEEDKNEMKKFGLIHSISVSGLHVVIIYGFLRIFIGRKAGLIGTLLYVIFTGCPYSSIRAFIMLACVEGGYILKRNSNSLSALSLSGIIMLIHKPYSVFQVSFVLSYLATIGILLYNKKLNYKLYKLPQKIRNGVSIALCAQIFTFPYIIYMFKFVSINFILGNLVLVPFVNIIVIVGNLMLVVYKFPQIFDFISYIEVQILKMFDFCIDVLDKFSLPNLYGNEYLISFYIFMLIGVYFYIKGRKKIIYMPAIYIFMILIQLYSPICKIQYYDEGALLLTYRGDRVLLSNKKNIDMDTLSKSAMADESYRDESILKINDIGTIKSNNKDYILSICGKKYLLKMNTSKNSYKDYVIINFKDGAAKSIFIIGGKVFSSYI